ncbi:hypothetical protein EV702DRAFT_1189003 [Suillus placidus]|uniref:HECT-type E3 ubiquitin transferase n=1 Tax=Suillus placidus TaxID=48579 RepID=A0A9P6ZL50_9AGAM|nr:hypothetical protein EV702DRAFT_1189003 [Suillus placidus]
MIDPKWLRMFNQQELQILLGGVNAPVDVQDLRAHTQYGGLSVLEDFDQEQRRLFLRFVTSCSRPPLLTCVNLLKLHDKLLQAISSGAGFDLS